MMTLMTLCVRGMTLAREGMCCVPADQLVRPQSTALRKSVCNSKSVDVVKKKDARAIKLATVCFADN
jgi:hypothetical protein